MYIHAQTGAVLRMCIHTVMYICRCDALYHFIFPCIIDQIYIFLSGPVLLAKLHQLCGLSFFKAQCTYPFQLEKDYGFVANIVLAWSSSVVWYLHLWLHLQLRGHVCSLVLSHSLRSRSPVSLFGSALEKALPPLFLLKYSRLFSLLGCRALQQEIPYAVLNIHLRKTVNRERVSQTRPLVFSWEEWLWKQLRVRLERQ